MGKGAQAATQRKVIRDFRAKGSNFLGSTKRVRLVQIRADKGKFGQIITNN